MQLISTKQNWYNWISQGSARTQYIELLNWQITNEIYNGHPINDWYATPHGDTWTGKWCIFSLLYPLDGTIWCGICAKSHCFFWLENFLCVAFAVPFSLSESAQLKESTTYAAHIWGHFEDVNVNSSQYQARTVSQGSSHVDSVCLCFHIIGATSIHTVKKIKKLPLVLCPCSKNYTKSICITSIYLSQFKIFHFSLCLRKKKYLKQFTPPTKKNTYSKHILPTIHLLFWPKHWSSPHQLSICTRICM